MTFGALKFRDSMKFNDAGLAKMIDSQRKVKAKLSESFPILTRMHPFVAGLEGDALEKTLDLILRKVPFPYTSLKDQSSFNLPAALEQCSYDDSMSGVACSAEKYAMVKKVVERFDLPDLGAYHDLYLFTDVLALADCMESMRKRLVRGERA